MSRQAGSGSLAGSLALLGLGMALTAGADGGPPAQALAPGSSIERKLAAAEIHAYDIEVPAGAFLGIRVEQRGIDVVVTLRDASGTVLRRHDSPVGDIDIESVSFLSPRASRYRIEVSCFDRLAFAGAYALTLDGPRPARSGDEARISAEKALERATTFFDHETAQSFVAAEKGYAEAARLFAPIDPRQQGIAVFGIASTESRRGMTEQALKSSELALALGRQAGDRPLEAQALGLIAFHRFLREGRAPALEPLHQAIGIETSPRIRSDQLANLAFFHWLLGRYEEALAENQKTLEIARSAGHRYSEALALKNLAQVYWSLGLPRRALVYADQALKAIRNVPEGLRIEAHILTTRGRIWRSLDDDRRSLEDLQAALIIRRKLGDGQGEALVLAEIARIQVARGERIPARESLDAALRLSRAARDPRAQAGELVLLGRIEEADGRQVVARAAWDEALAISRSIADRAGESSAEFAMARDARKRGELDRAAALVEHALDLVESLRAEIPLPDLRASYGASSQDDRQLLTEILIARDHETPGKGFAERAFHATERTRARALTEAIAEGGLAPGREISKTLRSRQSAANSRVAFLQRRLSEASDSSRQRLLAELAEAEDAFDRVVLEIRRSNPRLAALRYPQPLTAQDVRALLASDEAMISYALTEDGVFAFVLTRSGLRLVRLPADVRLLPGRVENFVELLSRADPALGPLADRLSADLIEPLRPDLPAGVRRLVIVPDGALHSLPFEALPVRDGAAKKSLIEDFAVSYAPSATVLSALGAVNAGAPEKREDLIAFADPSHDEPGRAAARAGRSGGELDLAALAPIPGARREVEAIARYASRGSRVYEGADASESRLKAEALGRYRILHFATHGLLSVENPGQSALLLAGSTDGAEDGILYAREISGLQIDSEMVVLSGCETARGRILSGEGVQGLARAFFLAGTRSVVATLWRVRDQPAQELVTAFYRRLAEGQSKDEALRGAKLEFLRKTPSSPARDWASFILIGEASGKIPLSPGRVAN